MPSVRLDLHPALGVRELDLPVRPTAQDVGAPRIVHCRVHRALVRRDGEEERGGSGRRRRHGGRAAVRGASVRESEPVCPALEQREGPCGAKSTSSLLTFSSSSRCFRPMCCDEGSGAATDSFATSGPACSARTARPACPLAKCDPRCRHSLTAIATRETGVLRRTGTRRVDAERASAL